MSSVDDVLLREAAPSSDFVETDAQLSDERMVFNCRPDLSGRSVLFQGRNPSGDQRQPVPVQLVTVDGRLLLGLSVPAISSNESPIIPRQDDDKLARILVTTKTLTDPTSEIRLRRLQLTLVSAAVGNFLLTVALLCPASTGAWYHADAYRSWNGAQHVERVVAVRPLLLATSMLSNGVLVFATYLRMDALLTVYISAIAVLDIWSLISLLPHALFFLRFLFDVLLVGITLEVRTHVEQTWFLTSFHRLRA